MPATVLRKIVMPPKGNSAMILSLYNEIRGTQWLTFMQIGNMPRNSGLPKFFSEKFAKIQNIT